MPHSDAVFELDQIIRELQMTGDSPRARQRLSALVTNYLRMQQLENAKLVRQVMRGLR